MWQRGYESGCSNSNTCACARSSSCGRTARRGSHAPPASAYSCSLLQFAHDAHTVVLSQHLVRPICWQQLLLLSTPCLQPDHLPFVIGAGTQQQSEHLAGEQRPGVVLSAINRTPDGSSSSNTRRTSNEHTSASSSSSSSSSTIISGSSSRRVLQALSCSLQCAPNSCRMNTIGGLTCYACNSGFTTTIGGGCGACHGSVFS
jgi:hypothetical protein